MAELNSYDIFAQYYDNLMFDIDYAKTVDYLEKLIKLHSSCENKLTLDLGCGTGKICIEFANRGLEMIGIDISPEMLDTASKNSREAGADVLYLNQDMTNFELYGTVGHIFCLLDGVNHVTDKRKLKRMFKLIKNYLDNGGLFIFDINTPYKLRKTLGNNVFYDIDEDISYIWQNSLNARKNIVTFDLTFFVKQGKELYKKHDVCIRERVYNIKELSGMLAEVGLTVEAIYGNHSVAMPKSKEDRIFIVAKN